MSFNRCNCCFNHISPRVDPDPYIGDGRAPPLVTPTIGLICLSPTYPLLSGNKGSLDSELADHPRIVIPRPLVGGLQLETTTCITQGSLDHHILKNL